MNENSNPNAVSPAKLADGVEGGVEVSVVRRIIIQAQHYAATPGYAKTEGNPLSE